MAAEGSSLVEGAVFVLDKGTAVWQFNTKASVGQEKFRAAEFSHSLLSEREGRKEEVPHVYGQPSLQLECQLLLLTSQM